MTTDTTEDAATRRLEDSITACIGRGIVPWRPHRQEVFAGQVECYILQQDGVYGAWTFAACREWDEAVAWATRLNLALAAGEGQ